MIRDRLGDISKMSIELHPWLAAATFISVMDTEDARNWHTPSAAEIMAGRNRKVPSSNRTTKG